jgi:hypothetical protein
MRHRAAGPLTTVWRRIPQTLARSLGALAELSPFRALFALVVTLGIGTGAFATVAHVGASLSDQPSGSAAVGRPSGVTPSARGNSPSAAGPTKSGRTPASVPRNTPMGPPTARAFPGKSSASASKTPRLHLSPPAVVRTPGPSTGSPGSPAPSDPASVVPDVTPPDTSLSEQFPQGDAAVFTFGANEPASFVCSLDGAAYAPCANAVHLTDLDPGAHTFAVRATDLAGNSDPSPAVVSWHANRGPSVNH